MPKKKAKPKKSEKKKKVSKKKPSKKAKKPSKRKSPPSLTEPSKKEYSDEELVAYCGVNCKECKQFSNRRLKLAALLKESLEELPLDLFSELIPAFKDIKKVMEFLEFTTQMGGMQICCTSTTLCGDPMCVIRICVKEKGIRTCAECGDYRTCSKLDFLKPHHTTLLSDLDFIKDNGLETYVKEKIAQFKLRPLVID